MRETCQVRQGGCRNDDTSRHFWFATKQLIFCDYRYFRKLSKHIVSTPTFPLPSDNYPSRRNKSFRRPHPSLLTTTAARPTPYAVLPKFRLYDWSKAPPLIPFAFNGVTGVCVVPGVNTPGDMSLRKPSFTRNACRSVKHNAAAIGFYRMEGRLRVEWQHGVERQRDPNRTHLHLRPRWIHRKLAREVAKERGSASHRLGERDLSITRTYRWIDAYQGNDETLEWESWWTEDLGTGRRGMFDCRDRGIIKVFYKVYGKFVHY